jgi:hypothetical protein
VAAVVFALLVVAAFAALGQQPPPR